MATGRGYNDHEYTKRRDALRRRAKREGIPCWLCHEQIDWDVPWKHARSFTADHVDSLANGGSLYGDLRVAHRGCNSRRGRGTQVAGSALETSIDW